MKNIKTFYKNIGVRMNNSQGSWDPIWEKIFTDQEWGKYPAEDLIRFVARNFYKKNRAEVKILEIGCGTGANLWYLAREGFTTFGIDASPTAVQIAKSRMQEEKLNASILTGDILNLPFESGYFDCVIDVECLYTNATNNTKKIIAEIYRVLKNDGLFFSRTFTDKMYLGETPHMISNNEFINVLKGPLEGKGFVRLTSKDDIPIIYGELFSIDTVDLMEYSRSGGEYKICEWIIVCRKNNV